MACCWKCCILTCQNTSETGDTFRWARCCRSACIGFCKWVPVWLVWTLIAWAYYAYVYVLCIETVEAFAETVCYLVFFHLLLFMLMWSYVRTVFTNVSIVPGQFHLTDDQETELRNETKFAARRSMLQTLAGQHVFNTCNKDAGVRYCEKCRLLKPDRCHHCSICGFCVLKMDHHCPWTNNCVGFYNYKFFLLLLVYSCLWLIYVAATTAKFTVGIFQRGGQPTYETGTILILEFVAVLFVIVSASLLAYHLCLITHNVTTLETFYPPTFSTGPGTSFDWGCTYNFSQIFGDRVLLWFIPVFSSLGDGVKFPVRSSVEDGSDVTADDSKPETVMEPRDVVTE